MITTELDWRYWIRYYWDWTKPTRGPKWFSVKGVS